MTDSPQPLWKELSIPFEEEKRLFEEWVKQQEEIEQRRDQKDKGRVIVVDI